MRSLSLYILILFAISACGGGANIKSNSNRAVVDASQVQSEFVYKLGPGDKVKVTVYQEEDLSGEFELDSNGYISLPYIQEVGAAGSSPRELSQKISKTFMQKNILRDPRVSVEVLNYRPFYIHGEVNEGGEFPYKSNMDVRNAVALAGGYSYRADENYAYIRREGTDAMIKVRLSDGNFPVLPGDNIEIPERFF